MCSTFINQEISIVFLASHRKKSMDALICLVNVYSCCKLMTYQYVQILPIPHLPSLFSFQSSLSYLGLGVLSQERLAYTFLSLSLVIYILPYFLSENPDHYWPITSEIPAIRHFEIKLHRSVATSEKQHSCQAHLSFPGPLTAKTLGTQQ